MFRPSLAAQETEWHYRADVVFLFLLLWVIVATVQGYAHPPIRSNSWLLLAFSITFIVIAFKALTLPVNHGPDEEMHIGSLYWYLENLRPPLVSLGDTNYIDLIWSSSYVLGASADISYLLTARTASLLTWILPNLADFQIFRLAQLILILIGAGVCARYCGAPYGMFYLASWLLIPQLAYTATYVNGDGLSFAMAMMACSMLLSMSDGSASRTTLTAKFLLAIFLLVNSKANYLPLLAVLITWYTVKYARAGLPTIWHVIVCAAAVPAMFYRRLFNYWDQARAGQSYVEYSHSRLMALFERNPASARNPSFESAIEFFQGDAPFRYVQSVYERMLLGPSGYNWHVLLDSAWYQQSLHSLFGVFGYMNAPVSWWLLLVPAAGLATVFVEAGRPPTHRRLLLSTTLLTIAASLFYSISQGPQPQGRYLFPAVCLGMALLAHCRTYEAYTLQTRVLPFVAIPTTAALLSFP